MNSPRKGWFMLFTDINNSLIIAALYCGCVCINIEPIGLANINVATHIYIEMLSCKINLSLDSKEMDFNYNAFKRLLKSIIVHIKTEFQDIFSLVLNVIAFASLIEEFVCNLNLKLNYELIRQC